MQTHTASRPALEYCVCVCATSIYQLICLKGRNRFGMSRAVFSVRVKYLSGLDSFYLLKTSKTSIAKYNKGRM